MVGTIQGPSPLNPGSPTSGSGAASGPSGLSSPADSLLEASFTIDSSIYDISVPRLSILDFQQQIGTAIKDVKTEEIKTLLIDGETYKTLRIDATISYALIVERLKSVSSYLEDYNALKDEFDTQILAPMKSAIDAYNAGNKADHTSLTDVYGPTNFFTATTGPGSNAFNLTQNPSLKSDDQLYSFIGGDAARQMSILSATRFNSSAEYTTFMTNIITAINQYNTHATRRNNETAAYNTAVAAFNAKISDFNTKVDALNAKAVSLGLTSVPNLSHLTSISTISNWPILPVPTAGTWSNTGGVKSITGQTPGFGDPRYSVSGATYNSAQDVAYLLTPPIAPAVTYSIPALDKSDYTNRYITPLLTLLQQFAILQNRVNSEVDFQSYFRLQYGQTVLGLPPPEPVRTEAANKQVAGAGNSVASITSGGRLLSNPRLSEILSQSLMDALYNTYGVQSGSLLTSHLDKQLGQTLEWASFTLVPRAVKFLEGVIPNSSPQNDALQGAVAFSFLQELQGLISGGNLAQSIYKTLMQDLAFAGKSEAELKIMASGLASGLSVQLLALGILEVEKAIGASGLLPQLLGAVGGMDLTRINLLSEGPISFWDQEENPLEKLATQRILEEELKKAGLDNESSKNIAKQALFASQGANDASDAVARFIGALNLQLQGENVSRTVSQEIAKTLGNLLLNQNDLKSRVDAQLKEESLNNELRSSLLKQGFSIDEVDRLLQKNRIGGNEGVLSVLNRANVDNPEASLASILSLVNNPLRSKSVDSPLTLLELNSALIPLLQKPFGNDQGPLRAKIEEIANAFTEGPHSIAALLKDHLLEVKNQIGRAQSERADESFRDFIEPKVSLVAFTRELLDPGKMLAFLDKVQYQGIIGKAQGAATPSGFGYMPNNSTLSI